MVEGTNTPSGMTRKDVYPKIPKFVSEFVKGSLGVSARYVISVLGQYPALTDRFAIKGYQEINRIENSLVTNDDLKPSERANLVRRIARLSSDSAPIWQNWVRETSATHARTFDLMVSDWLREPIDWKESRYFDPVTAQRRFGIESARAFFERLDGEHLDNLGLKLVDGVVDGSDAIVKCVFLYVPIREANSRAKALGVNFRFEKFV